MRTPAAGERAARGGAPAGGAAVASGGGTAPSPRGDGSQGPENGLHRQHRCAAPGGNATAGAAAAAPESSSEKGVPSNSAVTAGSAHSAKERRGDALAGTARGGIPPAGNAPSGGGADGAESAPDPAEHPLSASRPTGEEEGSTRLLHARLRAALARRAARGLLRRERAAGAGFADFSSNDYLGLSRDAQFSALVSSFAGPGAGAASTGSRLLTGHSAGAGKLEAAAAALHDAPAALLFNSGYAANVSLLACVPGPRDAVVYDAGSHASVRDGLRLSRAALQVPFARGCARAMCAAASAAAARVADGAAVLVAAPAVHSMDGAAAPVGAMLRALAGEAARAPRRAFCLLLDEAHAGGVVGASGAGAAAAAGAARHPALLARVVTLGKALGAHGALVLGSRTLRKFLLNYARPLVYSTALPPRAVAAGRAAYAFAGTARADALRARLQARVGRFRARAGARLPAGALLPSDGPIQAVLVPGNAACVAAAERVRAAGFDVYPIRAPTVPPGGERIRVVLHAHNTPGQVDGVVDALADALRAPASAKL